MLGLTTISTAFDFSKTYVAAYNQVDQSAREIFDADIDNDYFQLLKTYVAEYNQVDPSVPTYF